MVVFLLKAKARYTLDCYLTHWTPELATEVRVQTYEDLGTSGVLEPATYVFGDQERLSPRERRLAVELWEQLAAAGPAFVLLNDPGKLWLRFELLKALHDSGDNLFNVFRPLEALWRVRFPAFLHSTNGHEGALSPLLSNRLQLLRWLWKRVRPRRRGKLLVEEFCDVSDSAGHFAKYSSFNFGGEIVPRHVFFGKNWCLQDSEIMDAPALKAFEDYARENPHEQKLKEIFTRAHIDFGRIDYAFKDGKLQVWEINTNPMILGFPDTMCSEESALTEAFRADVQPHFRRLSRLHGAGSSVRYALSGRFVR